MITFRMLLVSSLRGFFQKNPRGNTRIPIKYRVIGWLVAKSIQNGDYVWLLARVVKYVAIYLRIDHEAKTWTITSEPMFQPYFQKVTYDDIHEIMRSKPSGYHQEEEHYPDGRFKRFSISTV